MSSVCATLTTQSRAANSPDAYSELRLEFWYTALTGLAVVPTGPKFAPVIVTRSESEPSVLNDDRPLRPEMAGAVYDVVPLDAADCWSPTVTFHA